MWRLQPNQISGTMAHTHTWRSGTSGPHPHETVLTPVSKWPPRPPDEPLGPILEVQIPDMPFFTSAKPLLREIEFFYELFQRPHSPYSGQPLGLLGERIAKATQEVEAINKQGRELRQNGFDLRAAQTSAREQRAADWLKILRREIPAHNQACEALSTRAERVKTNTLEPLLRTLRSVANQVPIGASGAIRGEVWVTDELGNKARLVAGTGVGFNSVIKTGLESGAQFLLLDGSVFTMGADSEFRLDELAFDPFTHDGTFHATAEPGMYRYIWETHMDRWPLPKRCRSKKVTTPVGCICIRGTDVVIKVGSKSRTIVSVVSGEVEVTFPHGLSILQEVPPRTVSAGEQLVIDRSHLSGVDAWTDGARDWHITLRETGSTAIEQQWRDEFGEPLPPVSQQQRRSWLDQSKRSKVPLATMGNLSWLDKDLAFVSEGVREWLGAVQTDKDGHEFYAPLQEYWLEAEGKPQVAEILKRAASTGKPAFMVLRDIGQAEYFAFFDPQKNEVYQIAFEVTVDDKPIGILGKEIRPDGALRVIHGDKVDGKAVVTRHEADYDKCKVIQGLFKYENGTMKIASVMDDAAWGDIESEMANAKRVLDALKNTRVGQDDLGSTRLSGMTWWKFIHDFRTSGEKREVYVSVTEDTHRVILKNKGEFCMSITVDEKGQLTIKKEQDALEKALRES